MALGKKMPFVAYTTRANGTYSTYGGRREYQHTRESSLERKR
jgi:hypothetical protein